jgi:RNA polymerase sigma-70 factor (family 1)
LPDSTKYTNTEERELLVRVVEGNELAFTKLVTLHWDHVFYLAVSFLKSYEEAEELTQDIFVKLWLKRDNLKNVENFVPYLHVISKNYLISHIRKAVSEPRELPTNMVSEIIPEAQLEFKQTYALIMEAMQHLTPQQKSVFELSRLQGLSQKEVSQRLNITERTVNWHIILALKFLKDSLHEQLGLLPVYVILILTILLNA